MEPLPAFILLLLISATQSFTAGRRLAFSFRAHDSKQIRGDPLRDAEGIRPSLHPLTINIIAEALRVRAKSNGLRVSETIQALQVAVNAGKIASDAIRKRQSASAADGMLLTIEEQQTVAGRVVGIVLRSTELEATLRTRCQAASWIGKYGEWDTFGVLSDETSSGGSAASALSAAVDERIAQDPLFAMNRAECLLAIFLDQVEAPELARKNATVADNSSAADFLDSERMKVLLDGEREHA